MELLVVGSNPTGLSDGEKLARCTSRSTTSTSIDATRSAVHTLPSFTAEASYVSSYRRDGVCLAKRYVNREATLASTLRDQSRLFFALRDLALRRSHRILRLHLR